MNAFAFETGLPAFMMQVATCGSVGSVAIWVEILGGRPRFSLLETAYLTPDWDQYGALLTVTERYLVSGADLKASGYAVASDALSSRFWWQRRWTRIGLDVFVPVPAGEEGNDVLDEKRSSIHDLGFVPVVWIRNPGAVSATEPDGECSFEKAIDTVIEADYLLSQAGRGLKYGSDPTLVLKTPEILEGVARQGGAVSALTLPPEGDAKLLEINGAAAGAVLAHYRELRQLVLEQLHGNRTHGDRLGPLNRGVRWSLCVSLLSGWQTACAGLTAMAVFCRSIGCCVAFQQ
ncbi:hypothetical protein [Asaia spathodeae]|uniref:hypothetical protein n=1 Tax=Asaia spathodeae TaxID=657016 RepID=UPI002FC371BB